jgi:ribonucleotide reductase alpha subunit
MFFIFHYNYLKFSQQHIQRMASQQDEMKVLKRNGNLEDISFDKILNRVKNLGNNIEPKLNINYAPLVMKVIDQLYPNIPTKIIDELAAEQCASLSTKHLDYGTLASRIIISNHHKNTKNSFRAVINDLYHFKDVRGQHTPLISYDLWRVVENEYEVIEKFINYDRDFLIDYFGFKTLERAYLMRINKLVVERPQHMWMRVAIGIHGDNLEAIKETYDLMSMKYFTHATPTLFNAGTPRPQLSSCYLISMENDSIDGIYNTLKECASISKWAGGIGLHVHNVRSTGSHIRGTNGTSNGIVPMLRVFNMTARYVDQGGNKRNGSFAIYLEPWHADIFEFLDLKKNHGDEELRARDLFYALWIPSLFMEKVKKDEDWHLFCPDVSPGLADCYGDAFVELYNKYVSENKFVKVVKARELWYKILDSQMETGTPYLLYKDAANQKSNQNNLGTIKSSNLCCEIIEYSDENQTAVCNLASISLTNFVNTGSSDPLGRSPNNKMFDYKKLHHVTQVITRNLNKIIDINYYPTNKTRVSNLLHRPIGIGVQGLADVFALMDLPFDCEQAKRMNIRIFETIYHASLTASNQLAKERDESMRKMISFQDIGNVFSFEPSGPLDVRREYVEHYHLKDDIKKHLPIYAEILASKIGNPPGAYSSFAGSPASNGILQFDMWGITPDNTFYDWKTLKQNIMQYGLRNSLLVAPMPTASTSQILGNNECFEPFTSNIYTRRTIAGEFIIVNKYLMKELVELKMWSTELKDSIVANKGSIQHVDGIPQLIKDKYRTVWEIPMKSIIDMAADRGAYICQSQSLNLWMEDPNYKTLTAMHFYSWQKGLKTGIYYLRRKPRHQPQQFTIEPEKKTTEDDDVCEMCSA